MPGYLTLIFVCQLLGELVAGALALPVPGPVLGMVALFAFLAVRGDVPAGLDASAGTLLRSMSLLFVPAGAGVMLHFQLLGSAILPLGLALLASTVLTILVTGLMMRALSRDPAE
ncbi:CidA/LrgA family protein [Tropicimonas sp. IMCC6043]|uniref:CidA/LrgA family protein n=1 Tax=Tropicimonas sp. IMCC6043 TaxID=2510645 RepID=UPI00101D3EF5|nr:CidA/LrgA family protein [Tropicimonas sp. IMCC6043]RYH10144.1 CidA/LrgA family protein [Tropicimonas sp. IMCC6043]